MSKAERGIQNHAAPLQCTNRKLTQELLGIRSRASPFSLFSLTVLHMQGFFNINFLENELSQLSRE